jgi:hypothetical protein
MARPVLAEAVSLLLLRMVIRRILMHLLVGSRYVGCASCNDPVSLDALVVVLQSSINVIQTNAVPSLWPYILTRRATYP